MDSVNSLNKGLKMSSKKALIVDDSTVTRMMIRKIITGYAGDWEIVEADSGDKANSLLDTLDDLFIATIDQNMPGTLSGLDIASIIKTKFPKTKIAMVTANIQDAIRNQAAALSIDFIEKPVTEGKIISFLKQG